LPSFRDAFDQQVIVLVLIATFENLPQDSAQLTFGMDAALWRTRRR